MQEKLDLILSDFTLPGYDGMSALARAQAICPEVPFIFVSGTLGEDLAIESLKSGAVDYVLKTKRFLKIAASVKSFHGTGILEITIAAPCETHYRKPIHSLPPASQRSIPSG